VKYTHTANGRTWNLYGCAKRGCDRINPDYLSFGTREGLGYCLNHIPLRSRLRLWWQERSRR
jgi:hypothetical protein